MYKFYSRPKAKSSSLVAIISIAAIAYAGMNTLSPQKTESIDSRVFVDGLTIHLSRNAPPLAALEDSIMDSSFAFEDQIPETLAKTKLLAGVDSLESFAQQVISENVPTNKSSPEKTISLKELGISREELLDALFIPMIRPEAQPTKGGANREPTRVIQARHFIPADRAALASTVPPSQLCSKKRRLSHQF
jgi:hypothetical protein